MALTQHVNTAPTTRGLRTATAALGAAWCLGQAIQLSNGAGHPTGFVFLGITLALLLAGLVVGPSRDAEGARSHDVLTALAGVAVLLQVRQLGSGPPAIYLQNGNIWVYVVGLVTLAAFSMAAIATTGLRRTLMTVATVISFIALSAWLLEASPNPAIDVFTETNEAVHGLFVDHLNPWSMRYTNIYHHTLWYGPGAADNDWIYVGFPYPPLSLLISAIGYAFGDIRWANVGALAIAALACGLSRTRHGPLGAVLLLTTPRVLFMLEQGWTDVYLIGLCALVLITWQRWPRLTPFALGLMLVSKQYMIFIAPLVPLLFQPGWSRRQMATFLGIAAGVGLLVNLPFIAMGPDVLLKALTYSQHPFRAESLSFLGATAVEGQPIWPVWIQWPLLLPVYALIWWRGPRGASGFALGSAALIGTFFAFSKHAFCNHHFLVIGLACLAVAFADTSLVLPPAPAAEIPPPGEPPTGQGEPLAAADAAPEAGSAPAPAEPTPAAPDTAAPAAP